MDDIHYDVRNTSGVYYTDIFKETKGIHATDLFTEVLRRTFWLLIKCAPNEILELNCGETWSKCTCIPRIEISA